MREFWDRAALRFWRPNRVKSWRSSRASGSGLLPGWSRRCSMGRTPIRWVLPCRFAMRWPRCERKELPGKSEVGKWKLEKRTKSDAPFEFLTESSQYYGLWLVHARTWSVSISRGRRRPDGALRGYGDLNERSTRFCTVLSKKTLH